MEGPWVACLREWGLPGGADMRRALLFLACVAGMVFTASGVASAAALSVPATAYGTYPGVVLFPVCIASGSQEHPAVSGHIVVWCDDRNGNDDIYGYDLATGTEFPVCVAPGDQWEPAISGDTVVWADGRDSTWDIYGGASMSSGVSSASTSRWRRDESE